MGGKLFVRINIHARGICYIVSRVIVKTSCVDEILVKLTATTYEESKDSEI